MSRDNYLVNSIVLVHFFSSAGAPILRSHAPVVCRTLADSAIFCSCLRSTAGEDNLLVSDGRRFAPRSIEQFFEHADGGMQRRAAAFWVLQSSSRIVELL